MYLSKVRIRENFSWDGLELIAFQQTVGRIAYADFSGITLHTMEDPYQVVPAEASLKLHSSTARMIYDELRRFYGDVPPDVTKEIIANLETERNRVNMFIQGLITPEGRLRTK